MYILRWQVRSERSWPPAGGRWSPFAARSGLTRTVSLSPPEDASFSLYETKPFRLAPHHLGIRNWIAVTLPGAAQGACWDPALGPQEKGTGFRGAGTQTQGVVLSIVLVQRPQDGLLGADGLQPPGSGHRAAKFLHLVFIALCALLEDLQTVGHAVLAGGLLAAKVGHEACKSRRIAALSEAVGSYRSSRGPQPTPWHFFLGRQHCIFPKAINTSRAVVCTALGPPKATQKNDLGAGEARPISTKTMTVIFFDSKAPDVSLNSKWGRHLMGQNDSLRSN